jgi:hypothetical protein
MTAMANNGNAALPAKMENKRCQASNGYRPENINAPNKAATAITPYASLIPMVE